MPASLKSRLFPKFRSAVFGIAVAGLFFALLSGFARERAGGEQRSRFMNRIDAAEGAKRLAAFRAQRLVGDYCFEFTLEHKPRRGRTVRYEGMMWGSWNEIGPVTRFRITPKVDDAPLGGVEAGPVELIIQNGHSPEAWILSPGADRFRKIEGAQLFEPILPELLYSPFDLQMPFVYWEDFVYEGPTLVGATRVAQQFLMLPPEGSASAERGIEGVRIGLDDTYDALWRIEVLEGDGEVSSRFSVESFKKVQDQYIVKRITLLDRTSRDRTTFNVKAAALGLAFRKDLYDPGSLLSLDEFIPREMDAL